MHVISAQAPCLEESGREAQSLVVLQSVAWVGLGIQIVDAQIERHAARFPFEALCQVEEFAVHIGLETCLPIIAASLSLYLDESARQVAILY